MITKQQLANSLRILGLDAIQRAQSGHPGMVLGMADIAEVLWNDFLKHNPLNPNWINRDRFVLSNGHGSMLLYALLHCSGYAISIEDLKNFRQLNTKTPGHPEYGVTPGIDMTTGPLGQGLASAVGMALAEMLLADRFNQEKYNIIEHYTYCFVGDGCLMEGVSHEACSLAGTLGLGKLIVFWDDNAISLDGDVINCCTEDVAKRFAAYNWHVIENVNGHDSNSIRRAILQSQENSLQPTLICCKTIIGFGSPNYAGSAKCHGLPLGEEEVKLIRKQLHWDEPPFIIPQEYYNAWNAREKGQLIEDTWEELFAKYRQAYPELAKELQRCLQKELPNNIQDIFTDLILELQQQNLSLATRESSQLVLDVIGKQLPELLGGAADVTNSSLTKHKHAKVIIPGFSSGNYMHYGVREFAMACIMNGISLHGGFIPYGGTFLVFSDYARPAIRNAAMMKQQNIYILTHDSIAIGPDGPTHQPVEQLASLRLIPNVSTWRPADAVETAVAWQMALNNIDKPTILALTRQKVTGQDRTLKQFELITKGGYILHDCKEPEVVLIATGSEVELAMQVVQVCAERNIRVVSMPEPELFYSQQDKYKNLVLPENLARIIIEAGVTSYWYKFLNGKGKIIGLDTYGKSASGKELYEHFGLTVTAIVEAINELLPVTI